MAVLFHRYRRALEAREGGVARQNADGTPMASRGESRREEGKEEMCFSMACLLSTYQPSCNP